MRKFILLWLGELISGIGSGMTAFALLIYVFDMTGSTGYVSAIVLAAFLPTILLSPLGGVLADRYDRRLLMIIGDLFSGLGLVYILWNIHMGINSMLPIMIGVTFNGMFVALLEPSFKATVTDLLSKDDYTKANGMVQIAANSRYLVSPILAGILLTISDIRLILILDICTFFLTVLTISLVRNSIAKSLKKEKEGIWIELREGFAVLKSYIGVRTLVILMSLVCFFIGFVQTLTVPMILAVSNAKTLGILESSCAVGMLAGSVIIGIFGLKNRYVRCLSLAGMSASIFMAMTGISADLYITGTGMFLFFASLPFINASADVLVRNNVENKVQGRVWGIISLLSQAGTAVAYAVSGLMADYISEPLLVKDGFLENSVGRIIGTGQGRGIGLMLIISGVGMLIVTFFIGKNRNVLKLEVNCGDCIIKFK